MNRALLFSLTLVALLTLTVGAGSIALGAETVVGYSAGAWGAPNFNQSQCGDHAYAIPDSPQGNLCLRYAVFDDDSHANTLVVTYDQTDDTTWLAGGTNGRIN